MAADLVLLALLFLGGKGKKGSPGGKITAKAHIATPAELLNRATQPRAAAWSPYFLDVGEIPAIADALARWSGIESSGDPTIVSSLGERGLLQVGTHTLPEGGISRRDWDELASPDTLPNEHARIASHYWRWLFTRAATHLKLAPPPDDAHSIDQIWFAYLYHQRPKDFTEWEHLPSSAAGAAATLMRHATGHPQLAKRVTAANIVAFGTPDAPAPVS